MLTRVVARRERPRVLEAQRDLTALCDLVDEFYGLLGERHWVFHDALPTADVRALLDQSGQDAAAAEQRFIALHTDGDRLTFWVRQLRYRGGFRERHHQIARALTHYQDEEFDSCVLHLIAVMDGFVNDFQPAVRKGLASRDFDDMVAWDSVVGHHQGFTHALRPFHRTFKKRVDDQVFEVHRHGIVHGAVVKFDNVVVATKAWNLLFAVRDWAVAVERAANPPEPTPTWRDAAATLWRHAKAKNYREQFEPLSVDSGDSGFGELDVVRRARAFLEAWEKGRWAILAEGFPPKLLDNMTSEGERAVWVKSTYELHPLRAFEISGVEFPEANVAVVRGFASIGGRSGPIALRWLHWRPDEALALPNEEDAEWFIGVYAPQAFWVEEDDER